MTFRGTVLLQNDFGPVYGDMVYRIVEATHLSQFRETMIDQSIAFATPNS
jgi:hypothetical protein